MKFTKRHLPHATACLLIFVLILLSMTGCRSVPPVTSISSRQPSDATSAVTDRAAATSRFESVKVTRITDGDTITVEGTDGRSRKVRILGVDSPEMALNGNPAEFFALEAKAFTEKILLNRSVYLERDNSDTDDYGRQLRYVWLDDPGRITAETIARVNFSALLISGGYAAAYRSGDDSKYRSFFLEYETDARAAHKGMWQNR